MSDPGGPRELTDRRMMKVRDQVIAGLGIQTLLAALDRAKWLEGARVKEERMGAKLQKSGG
jgi:hypothetical protein